MLMNIKFRCMLLWIYVFLFCGLSVIHAMDVDVMAESPEIPMEELEQINKEFADASTEFEKELPALQALKNEFDTFIKDVDLNDSGWFKKFRNKVLYAMPSDGDVTFGVYGSDVLKILFFASSVYLDKILFDRLSDYYHKSVESNLKQKKNLLFSLYDEKVACKDIEKFLHDSKSVNSFINECIEVLDFDEAINYKLFSYIFFNLAEKECMKFLEHQIFPTTNTGLFGLIRNAEKLDKKGQKHVVSIYEILGPSLMLYAFGLRSAFTGSSHMIRSFLLKYIGWDYKVLDAYTFDLTRRMIILTIFLKRLNIWYRNMFKKYLKDNMQYFLKVLSDAKSSNGLIMDADDALKNFLKNGMDSSFKQWFSYKNSCCANFELLIEGIILVPVFCKGAMFAYNNFIREG